MNKKAFTAATVILGLIGISTVVFFIVVIYFDEVGQAIGEYITSSMHKKQIVAENVKITSKWIAITPDEPLETTKLVQNVQLLIEGYEHDIHKNDFGNIQLKDGTHINPEVEIVDETGKTYQPKDGQRSGDLIGFSPNKEIHGTSSFPKNVKYKSIRIRSDKPFVCKKVIWNDYDLK